MSSDSTDDVSVSGHCYCGAITFAVRLANGAKPIFTAYCHCDSCRRAHAAPLYHVACVEELAFEITSGASELVDFRKEGSHIVRAFCRQCGSRILNRFPGWTPGGKVPLAFFPSTLNEADQSPLPEMLRPQKHNRPEECVLDREMLATLDHT